jgi:hypothetical protein
MLLLPSFLIVANHFLLAGADFSGEDAFLQNLLSEKDLVAASVVFLNREIK